MSRWCYDIEVPDIKVPDIEVPEKNDIEVPATLRSRTLSMQFKFLSSLSFVSLTQWKGVRLFLCLFSENKSMYLDDITK